MAEDKVGAGLMGEWCREPMSKAEHLRCMGEPPPKGHRAVVSYQSRYVRLITYEPMTVKERIMDFLGNG